MDISEQSYVAVKYRRERNIYGIKSKFENKAEQLVEKQNIIVKKRSLVRNKARNTFIFFILTSQKTCPTYHLILTRIVK